VVPPRSSVFRRLFCPRDAILANIIILKESVPRCKSARGKRGRAPHLSSIKPAPASSAGAFSPTLHPRLDGMAPQGGKKFAHAASPLFLYIYFCAQSESIIRIYAYTYRLARVPFALINCQGGKQQVMSSMLGVARGASPFFQ
jgi:hypothetical protein